MTKEEALKIIVDWFEAAPFKWTLPYFDGHDPEDTTIQGHFDLTDLAEKLAGK